jgi:hypothetical protein
MNTFTLQVENKLSITVYVSEYNNAGGQIK